MPLFLLHDSNSETGNFTVVMFRAKIKILEFKMVKIALSLFGDMSLEKQQRGTTTLQHSHVCEITVCRCGIEFQERRVSSR